MMAVFKNLSYFLATIVLISAAYAGPPAKSKVLASNIDTITLRSNTFTSSRRVAPIPQLRCVGGNGQDLHEVTSMHCKSQGLGSNNNDIQWTCTAETGPFFKLGSTQVLCEGYDHPDDPYILKGSCGVEYRLVLTEAGEEKYKMEFDAEKRRKKGEPKQQANNIDSVGVIFWILFIGVTCFILHGIAKQWGGQQQDHRSDRMNPRNHDDSNDAHPSPFDDNNDDDAPPPYWPNAPDSSYSGLSGSRTLAYGTGAAAGVASGVAAAQVYNRVRHGSNDAGEPGSRAEQEQEAQRISAATSSSSVRSGWTLVESRTSNSDDSNNFSTGFGGTTRR